MSSCGEPGPVRGAEDHVRLVPEPAGAVHLRVAAEQTVAVEGHLRRMHRSTGDRRARDDAAELDADRCGVRIVSEPVRRRVRDVPVWRVLVLEAATRLAVRVQVAGHVRELAIDLLEDRVGRIRGRVVGDARDVERGCAAIDATGRSVVAELRQRRIAQSQRASRNAVLAGHREVPGHIQVGALDPVALQRRDQVLHVRSPVLDRRVGGDQAIPVDAERRRRIDRLPGRVLQTAQGDDVVPALVEVLQRADDQVDVLRVAGRVLVGQRVELREDRLPLARIGVDHDHRLVGIGVAVLIRDRDDPGLVERRLRVELRDLQGDQAAGTEAIGMVEVGRIEVDAVLVRRQRG